MWNINLYFFNKKNLQPGRFKSNDASFWKHKCQNAFFILKSRGNFRCSREPQMMSLLPRNFELSEKWRKKTNRSVSQRVFYSSVDVQSFSLYRWFSLVSNEPELTGLTGKCCWDFCDWCFWSTLSSEFYAFISLGIGSVSGVIFNIYFGGRLWRIQTYLFDEFESVNFRILI